MSVDATTRALKIACCGASGTGKSTIAAWLSETLGLPRNPVGARVVAAEMGFASPYDVDAAGRRLEFQQRLTSAKVAWETSEVALLTGFVTDRTPLDDLAYSGLHCREAVTDEFYRRSVEHTKRYELVLYFPLVAFQDLAGDPCRVTEAGYHRVFDATLRGLLFNETISHERMSFADLAWRKTKVLRGIREVGGPDLVVENAPTGPVL